MPSRILIGALAVSVVANIGLAKYAVNLKEDIGTLNASVSTVEQANASMKKTLKSTRRRCTQTKGLLEAVCDERVAEVDRLQTVLDKERTLRNLAEKRIRDLKNRPPKTKIVKVIEPVPVQTATESIQTDLNPFSISEETAHEINAWYSHCTLPEPFSGLLHPRSQAADRKDSD